MSKYKVTITWMGHKYLAEVYTLSHTGGFPIDCESTFTRWGAKRAAKKIIKEAEKTAFLSKIVEEYEV